MCPRHRPFRAARRCRASRRAAQLHDPYLARSQICHRSCHRDMHYASHGHESSKRCRLLHDEVRVQAAREAWLHLATLPRGNAAHRGGRSQGDRRSAAHDPGECAPQSSSLHLQREPDHVVLCVRARHISYDRRHSRQNGIFSEDVLWQRHGHDARVQAHTEQQHRV